MNETKKLFRTALQNGLEKDLRITQLSKILKDSGISGIKNDVDDLDQFVSYGRYFTENNLAVLRGISYGKFYDATFIRNCLLFLYKNNLSALKTKSASGKSKEPISPEKIMVMESMFRERIEAIPNIKLPEKHVRLANFKQSLAKSIYEVVRSAAVMPRRLQFDSFEY